jgi:hypothetical protein
VSWPSGQVDGVIHAHTQRITCLTAAGHDAIWCVLEEQNNHMFFSTPTFINDHNNVTRSGSFDGTVHLLDAHTRRTLTAIHVDKDVVACFATVRRLCLLLCAVLCCVAARPLFVVYCKQDL